MIENLTNLMAGWDLGQWLEVFTSPSLKTLQMVVVVYIGLLWLSVIIWVTRDAIGRSNSLLFQVMAILLNIVFPILGILLYLIIRPGKTTLERYYEELEHRLILESIHEKGEETMEADPSLKILRRKIDKKAPKKEGGHSHSTH
jgi:hypothetical protein